MTPLWKILGIGLTRVYCVTVGRWFIIMGWASVSAEHSAQTMQWNSVCHCLLLYEHDEAQLSQTCTSSHQRYVITCVHNLESFLKALWLHRLAFKWTLLFMSVIHAWPFPKRNSPLCIVSTVCKQPTLSVMVCICSCINQNLPYVLLLDWSSLWISFT